MHSNWVTENWPWTTTKINLSKVDTPESVPDYSNRMQRRHGTGHKSIGAKEARGASSNTQVRAFCVRHRESIHSVAITAGGKARGASRRKSMAAGMQMAGSRRKEGASVVQRERERGWRSG